MKNKEPLPMRLQEYHLLYYKKLLAMVPVGSPATHKAIEEIIEQAYREGFAEGCAETLDYFKPRKKS